MFQFFYNVCESCQIVVGGTILLFIITPLYIVKYIDDCINNNIHKEDVNIISGR